MNPVVMVAYNNLELTKKAVESVFSQDIPVNLYFVDNGSSDGTWEWILTQDIFYTRRYGRNESPVKIANFMAQLIFKENDYMLGVPNDVVLPKNCYRELLRYPRAFVCASDVGQNMDAVNQSESVESQAVNECTPFAVMLIRKWGYDALVAKDGYFFDRNFVHYASDCDMALRMAACGIRGIQTNVPFWHFGSATWRLASEEERKAMLEQADKDRSYFENKWKFRCDSLEYGQRPADINFKG